MSLLTWGRGTKPPPPPTTSTVDPWDLDTPLFHLTPHDPFTIRQACEGVQIFGSIGSGKTSGSGATLALAMLKAGFGGVVLCAKPEERELWEQYAHETGRQDDLMVVGKNRPYRFNFLDYEYQRSGPGGGLIENIVQLFTEAADIAEGKQGQNTGERYWRQAMEALVRNAVDLLTLAYGRVSLAELTRFVREAPQSLEDVDPKKPNGWEENSFCAKTITLATHNLMATEGADTTDLDQSATYFMQEFASLASRTRSSIVSHYTSVADKLSHGLARQLFCTETNLFPEDTYRRGSIIVLDLPIQEFHDIGKLVQGIFKYCFQRALLGRDVRAYPRPVFLWADEAQNFVSSFDFKYQSVARSARACTVYLTQNISNYYSVLGAQGQHEAHALLGNLTTKIFHAQSDHATNQYAADLIAQDYQYLKNYSSGERGSVSSGAGEHLQYKVLPAAFTSLRKGGPENDRQVEGIVFQGGRLWRHTGDTFLPATFNQFTFHPKGGGS